MERKRLEEAFQRKLAAELKAFEEQMMQREKCVIFASAYLIHCLMDISQILIELNQNPEFKQLKDCMDIPELLAFIYEEWLKASDSQREEMEGVIRRLLEEQPDYAG